MQNPFKGAINIDFYTNQARIKWFILIVAIIIGGGSIVYTNSLVAKLKKGEEDKIKLWAQAVEFSSLPEVDASALTFISNNIIGPDNTLPVIVVDSATQQIYDARNVGEEAGLRERMLRKMRSENDPFKIIIHNGPKGEISDIQYVYYRNSYLLRQLSTYPYIQLSVIAIFGFIAYLAFSYSRRSEQNRVWVGMAKETAHQLGTPLSSLIAWVEYLKGMDEMKDRDDIIVELEKDVVRLEMITERFSNIGSVPVLKSQNVYDTVNGLLNYLKPRVSSKVNLNIEGGSEDIMANLNKPLFEWVLENVVKNGVDAMSGIGNITVTIGQESEHEVFVDIADDGKGITKGKVSEVFKPGFTTKKRGWGLGLALVKRIIENYHNGRIFVKSSQVDVGTVFRIILSA
ncbi:ATP-binding protein [Fabibacter sp. E12]|nr:ATP-binding protein [Roseivirga sp. E12]MBO3699550.1 ATP-binding protein [Roseivirga sp. E12]